ncbi:MAG: hypothetical protein HY350_03360 [Candidatus Omnitrophica bacterium]|nr:hypothetical protein [Candidatus Omnitrophota bacterium]
MKNYLFLILILSISGCATFRTGDPKADLSLARQSYQEGNYERTVVLLEGYRVHGHLTKMSGEEQFLLAEAYYKLKDYQQSGSLFKGYLDNYPRGKRSKEAYEYLNGINKILARDESLIRKKPVDGAAKEEPQDIQRANIVIENEHSYTLNPISSGDIGADSYLVITGIAFNNGTLPVNDLRVEITIYNFFEQILDVSYASLGHLDSGDKRPFSVKIPYLKKVAIDRYKIEPLWGGK